MATDTDTAATPAPTDVEHEHHPSHVQHHFVSSAQQFDSAKLGMWLFLITEVLLFSGMFVAYTVFRQWHPTAFAEASATLNRTLGTINTIVLLTSSLTVALSIHYIQRDKIKQCFYSLVTTIGLAGTFMVIKYFEYTAKFEHGAYPAGFFEPHGAHYEHLALIPYAPQFFSIYFVMTGIHGLHVLIGMVVIGWVAFHVWRGAFSSEYYTHVELAGLYWHLVDIIWIFLFPLLYLI